MANKMWSPRKMLVVKASHRGADHNLSGHASLEQVVSLWKYQGTNRKSVEYYQNTTDIALNRLVNEVQKRIDDIRKARMGKETNRIAHDLYTKYSEQVEIIKAALREIDSLNDEFSKHESYLRELDVPAARSAKENMCSREHYSNSWIRIFTSSSRNDLLYGKEEVLAINRLRQLAEIESTNEGKK